MAIPTHRLSRVAARAQSHARHRRPAPARRRQPGRHRPSHRPQPLDRVEPRRRPAGRRASSSSARSTSAPARARGRPPAACSSRSTSRPARSSGSTSATATCGSPSPTCPSPSLAESAESIDVDTAGHEGLDLAAGLIERLLDEAGVDRDRVLAAGMGLPAPIDRATRPRAARARSSRRSTGSTRPSEMGSACDMPVHLDNDANVGALGESTFGAGAGAEVMAYLRLSAGIGAGLVIGGRPFRGARGVAGEIGHVLVDPQGPICRCGNRGCLETFVGRPGAVRAAAPLARRRSPCRSCSRSRPRATPAAGASSTTPAASSAAPWPTSATSSTPTSWSSAATSPRRATCCSTRCATPSRRFADPGGEPRTSGITRGRARRARRGARRAGAGRPRGRGPLTLPVQPMSHHRRRST